MKLPEPYACDAAGCGKQRSSDANHWWLVFCSQDAGRDCVVIAQWNAADAALSSVKHACGIDCAVKIAAATMARFVDAAKNAAGKETEP